MMIWYVLLKEFFLSLLITLLFTCGCFLPLFLWSLKKEREENLKKFEKKYYCPKEAGP